MSGEGRPYLVREGDSDLEPHGGEGGARRRPEQEVADDPAEGPHRHADDVHVGSDARRGRDGPVHGAVAGDDRCPGDQRFAAEPAVGHAHRAG
ncbi:MAG: hypothetical protein ACYCUG_06660 [Acidimicrobiales bacterium]